LLLVFMRFVPCCVRRQPRHPFFTYTALFRSRVVDAIGRAGLTEHPSAEMGLAAKVGANQLHGHNAIDEDVAGSIDDAHAALADADRKSTRLNSSHVKISYAVFCLKKKK